MTKSCFSAITAFLFLAPILAVSGINAQSIDDIEGPVCILKDTVDGKTYSLSPEQSMYNVVITDGLAHIQLTQLFVNRFKHIKDIAYVFPLPDQGSVHSMSMEYHDSLYTAKIYKKEEAQQIYDSIVNKGGNAGLLLQIRPNIFEQRLANIAYNDSAYIRIGLSLPLKYDNGVYELAIPTMIGERYQSSGEGYVPSSGTLWNPPVDRDGQTLQINVLVQTGFPITGLSSPTHPIRSGTIDQMRSTLEQRDVLKKDAAIEMQHCFGTVLIAQTTYPNRDYVLRFSRAEARQDFSIASDYDTQKKIGHFAMNIFPDSTLFKGARPDLEIVLLIDRSGSQGGWPIAKEKEIALDIISRLLPTDRLCVIGFDDVVEWAFGTAALPATAANITIAKTFIANLGARGGTELLAGVQAALSIPQSASNDRYYIFLTDGFVTNETTILETIKNHPSKPTVFTFGCGNNINRYLIDQAAATGNGGYGTVITQTEPVGSYVDAAWQKIESPQLKNITIDFSAIGATDIIMPSGTNLLVGRPVEVYGRYATGGMSVVTVRGERNGAPVEIVKSIPFSGGSTMNFMVPQVWARQTIELLALDEGTTTKNRDAIIELSVAYQVLSKYTAFLAINPQPIPEGESYGGKMQESFSEVDDRGTLQALKAGLESLVLRLYKGMLRLIMPERAYMTELRVFDLQGRCVFTFASSAAARLQTFEWDGKLAGSRKLMPGCYVARVQTTAGVVMRPFSWK